jgi:hypothetical protein
LLDSHFIALKPSPNAIRLDIDERLANLVSRNPTTPNIHV